MSYEYKVVRFVDAGDGQVIDVSHLYEGGDEREALKWFGVRGVAQGAKIAMSRRSVEPWEVVQEREIVSKDTITRRRETE